MQLYLGCRVLRLFAHDSKPSDCRLFLRLLQNMCAVTDTGRNHFVQVLTEFDPPDEAVPQQIAWCGSDALVVKYEVRGGLSSSTMIQQQSNSYLLRQQPGPVPPLHAGQHPLCSSVCCVLVPGTERHLYPAVVRHQGHSISDADAS